MHAITRRTFGFGGLVWKRGKSLSVGLDACRDSSAYRRAPDHYDAHVSLLPEVSHTAIHSLTTDTDKCVSVRRTKRAPPVSMRTFGLAALLS
jgi:hypothetical protein